MRLQKIESALIRSLERDRLLAERVDRLMTIPAVGPITALTWALEVGDVKRFSSIKKAISYCGLCSAERSSPFLRFCRRTASRLQVSFFGPPPFSLPIY